MTITLSTTVAPNRVGPGMYFSADSDFIGALAGGEYWQAFVVFPGTADFLCELLVADLPAPRSLIGVWGIRDSHFGGFPVNVVRGALDNATVDLSVSYRTHAGGFLDGPQAFAGFKWDPASALWRLASQTVAPNPDIAAILAAVQKTY